MPTLSRTLASLGGGGGNYRRTTIAKLLNAKTISFFGGVCLLINGMTGPGVPFTPATFQESGWFFPLILFGLFALVSALSVLFIIEAMQAIPGNKHFQGTVEFATLINFYFGNYAHYFGQFLLYGALQSNAMQSIVIMAQTFDSIVIDIFGKTCGLALSGPSPGWYCVNKISANGFPSPFEDTWMLFTVGILLVLIFCLPLGVINLDDNIIAQVIAFWLSVAIGLEWIGASFYNKVKIERVPVFGNKFGTVVGTIMLNLAFTTVVPSWVNIKKRTVNAQSVVWTAVLIAVLFYICVGLIPALGFDIDDSGSILPALVASGKLNKSTAYMFSIVMLLPSIPVNFIVAQSNLVQNKVAGKYLGIFLAHVLPWFLCIPLQTGQSMQSFISWTSLIFVSTANFIIPLIIYLKCQRFRRDYNENRILTIKQKFLLKEIHWSSRTIHKFIDDKTLKDTNIGGDFEPRRRELPRDRSELSIRGPIPLLEDESPQKGIVPTLPTLAIDSVAGPSASNRSKTPPPPSPASSILKSPKPASVPTDGVGLEMPAPLKRETTVRFEGSGEDTSSEASLGVHNAPEESDRDVYADRYSKDNESPSGQEEYLKDDVPDPDMEHKLARLETRRWDVETGPRGMRSTLSRALKGITRTPSITSSNPSYSRPGRSTDLSASPERNAEGEAVRMENLRQSQEPDGTMYPSDSETRDASIPNPPGAPIRRGTTGSTTTDVSDGADLIRKNTLPIHPQYVSPTFRSIPTWFPVRGRVVAWALLIITSAVSVANIIVAIAGVG